MPPRKRINPSAGNLLHRQRFLRIKPSMQISKTFLILYVAVTGILPILVYGADSDAQAKAREALEKELYGVLFQEEVENGHLADLPNFRFCYFDIGLRE